MLAPQMKSASGSTAQQTNTLASTAIAPNDAASVGRSNIDATTDKNMISDRRDLTSRRRNNPKTPRAEKATAKPLFKDTLSATKRPSTPLAGAIPIAPQASHKNAAGLIPSNLVQRREQVKQTTWNSPSDGAVDSTRRTRRRRSLPSSPALPATNNIVRPAANAAAPSATKRIASHGTTSNNSTSRATYIAGSEPVAAPNARRFSPLTPLARGRATHLAAIPSILVQKDEEAEADEETEARDASDSQTEEDIDLDTESDEAADAAADAEAASLRLRYASDLYEPLSSAPVQRATKYLDQAGLSLDAKYAVSYFRSVGPQILNTEYTRRSANGQYWVSTYALWKSPNLAHRPLYFEDANLERFGGERLGQPLFSAAHFFASVATLPYQIGQNPGNDLYYVSGYGRPGNEYCLRRERPTWERRGASLQALITNAIIFGLL